MKQILIPLLAILALMMLPSIFIMTTGDRAQVLTAHLNTLSIIHQDTNQPINFEYKNVQNKLQYLLSEHYGNYANGNPHRLEHWAFRWTDCQNNTLQQSCGGNSGIWLNTLYPEYSMGKSTEDPDKGDNQEDYCENGQLPILVDGSLTCPAGEENPDINADGVSFFGRLFLWLYELFEGATSWLS